MMGVTRKGPTRRNMDYILAVKVLLLLMAANGAPILARRLLGGRFKRPVDNHRRLADGQPLFGTSKTWRGLFAALLATPVVAVLMSLSPWIGLLTAVFAMTGDLLSSFVKRRLRIPASGMALGLDQIPESLLPLLVVGPLLDIGGSTILLLTLLFVALELALSQLLYRLNIRKRPY
jgi:CDP-2,3-bis-(O-geranylgeranyl)-sn-glycerol synthase